MQDLEQSLNRAYKTQNQDLESQHLRSVALYLGNWRLISLVVSLWRGLSPSLPINQTQIQPNQVPRLQGTAPSEILYLLLCIPHRKWATRLIQMDACTIQSDQKFFSRVRSQYHEMRGKWSSPFSLRTLRTIRFVHFEMYKSELVDIRKTDDTLPESKEDECLYLSLHPSPQNENRIPSYLLPQPRCPFIYHLSFIIY